jgi:hypothetical protein
MRSRARIGARFVTIYLGVFATLLAWWYVLGLTTLTDQPLVTLALAYAVPVLAWWWVRRLAEGRR